MYARAVDDAGTRLRELRNEEWFDLALAGAALGLAMGATEYAPSLTLPLFSGGLALGVLGIRALWRHWDLVDRLADEPAAYAISEVFEYALRETTMERRQRYAALIRHHLEPTTGRSPRLDDAAAELAALADELEDEALELSPACAVVCSRLVSDPTQSPLLNPALPRDDLRSGAHRIRMGLTRRRSS
jgi:hypothetical protein